MKDWQAYALAAFGVAAGQVLKIGRKIEAGEPIGWRDIGVLCSMLPAFGSLIGAAGAHYGMAVYQIILASLVAGWAGFGFMKIVFAGFRAVLGQLTNTKVD